MKMLEKAWKIKKKWAFLWMEMGWKKSFINISWNEKWLVFRIEFSWEMDDENPFINIIWIWKWLMKISENWNRIINISEDWNRLMNISGLWKWNINTSEIFFWIIWWKIMISMRIKMFALNSMEKKCMNISRGENQLWSLEASYIGDNV